MKLKKIEQDLFKIAKILSIIIIICVFIFILLAHGFSLETLIEMLIPLALLVIMLVSWKYPQIGGILFILIGIFYFIQTIGRTDMIVSGVIISGILVVTGVLFLLSKR